MEAELTVQQERHRAEVTILPLSLPPSPSPPLTLSLPLPRGSDENPPYGYWMYYTYANLCVLNQVTERHPFHPYHVLFSPI